MKLIVILVALLAFPVLATAGVNPENGSFYITYNDITQRSGDHELNLDRTYNSLSSDLGWFGYGWGSQYETRLVVLPDGSAAIKENGAGLTTYYRGGSESAVKAGIERIIMSVQFEVGQTGRRWWINIQRRLTSRVLHDGEIVEEFTPTDADQLWTSIVIRDLGETQMSYFSFEHKISWEAGK
jgi:hypothetical protein